MSIRMVTVYLDTGMVKQHEVEYKDEAEFKKFVNTCIDALTKESIGGLIFGKPYCIYKAQNIIAIEFSDPPAQTDKLPMGLVKPKQ